MQPEPLAPAAPAGNASATKGSRHPLLDTKRPLGRAVRLFSVAAVVVAAFALGVPLCPFAILTRHPCPGCGLTRASVALLRGHLGEAAHFHPLVFVVTPVVAVAFAYNAFSYVRRGDWFASERLKGRWVNAAWILLGALMISLWIARFFGAFGGPVPV